MEHFIYDRKMSGHTRHDASDRSSIMRVEYEEH
jgi:hypothetical protein